MFRWSPTSEAKNDVLVQSRPTLPSFFQLTLLMVLQRLGCAWTHSHPSLGCFYLRFVDKHRTAWLHRIAPDLNIGCAVRMKVNVLPVKTEQFATL